jgi:hypothetical protein
MPSAPDVSLQKYAVLDTQHNLRSSWAGQEWYLGRWEGEILSINQTVARDVAGFLGIPAGPPQGLGSER